MSYTIFEQENAVPVKAWINNVSYDSNTIEQAMNLAKMPFLHRWVALMPDCHFGSGSTIGSVFASSKAIIPASVSVDIGCGMMSAKLSLNANHLPDNLHAIRMAIEDAVPTGNWPNIPNEVSNIWNGLNEGWKEICARHPKIEKGSTLNQLGTLGGGNHFIELCLDESDNVWIMLHSGSRGVGHRIGNYFINTAKEEMKIHNISLPDKDLAYLSEGTKSFDDYIMAVGWAQDFAKFNRNIMFNNIVKTLRTILPDFTVSENIINCHHNYVQRERHYDEDVWVTRKGAVRAGIGEYGIIPGSMGAKSFIVTGRGNPESFMSCSHGAGRAMSRTKAKQLFTVEDHIKATEGIECRKDVSVIDETPMAYKNIDDVMNSQTDLVDIVHQLRQIICVKG